MAQATTKSYRVTLPSVEASFIEKDCEQEGITPSVWIRRAAVRCARQVQMNQLVKPRTSTAKSSRSKSKRSS